LIEFVVDISCRDSSKVFPVVWALLLVGGRVDMKMVKPIGLFYENTNDIFCIVRVLEAVVLKSTNSIWIRSKSF
jgi:hypothetical protein